MDFDTQYILNLMSRMHAFHLNNSTPSIFYGSNLIHTYLTAHYACQEQMYINEDKKHRHSMPSDKSFYDQINIEGSAYFFDFCRNIKSLVIRQKGDSQNGVYEKTKRAKFSKKLTFLSPLTY